MAVLTSKLIVELVDRLTGPVRGVNAALNKLKAAQDRNNARLDALRGRMVEAGAVAYGLARAVAAPVNAATAFETKLEDIGQKIDEPVERLPELGRAIRAVANDTSQSASAIAEGMDVLAGMGASRNDALGLLNPIGRAATAYNAQIAYLSQAGFAALDNLKVPAEQFGAALDAMAQAGKAGAFELKDMAQYFPELGAGYQALGQTGVPAVADLAAALQIVRKGTGDSASAATNLSNILQKVYAPKTVKAFKAMGIDLRKSMDLAQGKGMSPIEAITEITNEALGGDLSRLGELFADAQVQQGLRPLIQNLELYRQIRAEAMDAQGVVEDDYLRRLETGAAATERWKNAVESLNIAIGTALLPALTSLAETLTPIIVKIGELADRYPGLNRAIVVAGAALVALRVAAIAAQFGFFWMKGGLITGAIAGLNGLSGAGRIAALAFTPVTAGLKGLRTAMIGYAAAAAAGGHGAALSAMGSGLLGLLNPLRLVTASFHALKLALVGTGIGAIVVAIAMAGTWITNNWSGIAEMFSAFGSAFMAAIEPIRPALAPVIDGVRWLWDTVAGLLGPIDEGDESWRAFGTAAGAAIGGIVAGIVELPGKVAAAISEMIARLRAFGAEMVEAGKALMAALLEGIKAGAQAVLDYVSSMGSRIKGSITGAASGAWSSIKSYAGFGDESPVIAGARAAGGPVRAGLPYLVGERGPELFTPNLSGRITPNNALGRGGASRQPGTINLTLNLGGVHGVTDPEVLAARIVDITSRKLRQAMSGIQSDIGYAAGM